MSNNRSDKYIRNAINSSVSTCATNSPTQYGSKQKELFGNRSRRYFSERAKYASDYCACSVQGLTDDFYEYTDTFLRLSDITMNSVYTSRKADDYKQVLFPDERYDYIPIGAKVKTMGNTWLVINPDNMSSPYASTIIARCNATYNSYDEYGNVVTEPIVVDKYAMAWNNPVAEQNIVLMEGSFAITCQKNKNTERLRENSRIILGNKPYHLSGVTDFLQEFTGDRDSVHLMTFTARVEEPTIEDDITVNFIANGNSITFGADLDGDFTINAGESATLNPTFTVNGTASPLEVHWDWETSDASVAAVADGVVTGFTVGQATVTAVMRENKAITASAVITVAETASSRSVAFIGATEPKIKQFSSAKYTAGCFENGVLTGEAPEWSFHGADGCYSVTYGDGGKTVTVFCRKPSSENLTLVASWNGESAETPIELAGY